MSTDRTMRALRGQVDARSTRGILSRGYARYGVARAPKPGSLLNIQKAAKRRLSKMQGVEYGKYMGR